MPGRRDTPDHRDWPPATRAGAWPGWAPEGARGRVGDPPDGTGYTRPVRSAILLGEAPTGLQRLGVAAILAAVRRSAAPPHRGAAALASRL